MWYGIKMYPDEMFIRPPEAWKNITSVILVTIIWVRNGVRYEDFMNSVEKDTDERFRLEELKAQLDRHNYCKVSFSQFDIQTLQMMPLKLLKLENIGISLPTLPISLEKLVLWNCVSIIEFPLLPQNLKELELLGCDQVKFIGSDDMLLEGTGFHGKIPTSLRKIALCNLQKLIWIDELPPSLETLAISSCNPSGLTMAPLPRHLKNLRIEFKDC